MNVSVILGHPYDGSFNAAIAQTVVQTLEEDGHAVAFHDLHAEGFNPVIPPSELVSDVPADDLTALHQREIKEADGIVVVHPNWWGQPPAILKGWVDRVLRGGRGLRFAEGDSGGGLPIGLLKARAVLVFNTSNTPEARELEAFGRSAAAAVARLHLRLLRRDHVRSGYVPRRCRQTPADRRTWLEQARTMTRESFPSEWNSAARSD